MAKLSIVLNKVNYIFAILGGVVVLFTVGILVWESILRSFFNQPTQWVYEISQAAMLPILFLCLAYATQRGSHVRMDTFFIRQSPRFQNWLWVLIYLFGVCLGIFALWASVNAVREAHEFNYITQNTAFPLLPFYIIMPIGITFFLLQEIIFFYNSTKKLFFQHEAAPTNRKVDITGVGVCIILIGFFTAFSLKLVTTDPMMITLIALVLFLIFLFIGVPIAIIMGILAMVGLVVARDFTYAMHIMSNQVAGAVRNYALLPLPLFVLMGEILIAGDASKYLMEGAKAIVGTIRAGLGYAALVASTLFAAVTGLSAASCATIGPAAIKEMTERGYDRSFSLGLVAAAGGLAVVIPPSATFILYSYIAEVSVGKLFMAGILPGILLALSYGVVMFVVYKLNPKLVPARITYISMKERSNGIFHAAPIIAIGLFVLISIYLGITSVTEAAALGTLCSIVYVIIDSSIQHRSLKNVFKESLLTSANTLGFALIIVTMAIFFGYLLSFLGVPIAFTKWIVGLGLNKEMLLLATMVLLIVLGAFLDTLTIILMIFPVLIGPLFAAGIDPIYLGVLMVLNMEMALVTPPFGLNIFILQGVCKPFGANYANIVRGVLPYIVADIAVLVLVAVFPQIALWIPSHM
jgi:C4-dicarboxylate transporter, DctM subunit